MGFHNPKHQRGIFANTAETLERESLAEASGWDSRKRETLKLTCRVMIRSTARCVGECRFGNWSSQVPEKS